MTEPRHRYLISGAEPAPEGLKGRFVTIGCTKCSHTRKTITPRTDDEIQTELDAHNAVTGDN